MTVEGEPWGWAGPVEEFLSTSVDRWIQSLADHHERLWSMPPAGSQKAAWTDEYHAMAKACRRCVAALPTEAPSWGVVFEFELPLEGGRRPDVVVLAGRSLVVLESKSSAVAAQADIDQARGYSRDLTDYHGASHDLPVHTAVVLTGAEDGFAGTVDGVILTSTDGLDRYLFAFHEPGSIDLSDWLDAPYHPLPTLVDAARRIFRDEPLPHVKRALAAGIPETVELLSRLVDETASAGGRSIAFVTGVPGAGKTLVGLRLVHERSETHGRATFLSGNGPLVRVLQDALASKVFVRDLHAFVKTYALNQRRRDPEEHVVVFDEAQRAWDAPYMHAKKEVEKSEPDLLVDIGERISDWATLVGLVGEGQEIHSGEEAGIAQWAEAAKAPNANKKWVVHCPPRLEGVFEGLETRTHELLDLTVSLRSRRAEHLHQWVQLSLEGSLALAARRASRIQADSYPVYITRSLDEAIDYVRGRFVEEPDKRTGLLASSHAKLLPKYDIDNSYQATSRLLRIDKWFNAPADDPLSSNALEQCATEFGCQGLELDLPILCWGEDYRWSGGEWLPTPIRRRYRQDDPVQLLQNAYRVLMTRGRDGLVIYLPDASILDETEVALLAAGVRPIPDIAEVMESAELAS